MSRLVFIVGPTATGKTDVAYNISKRSGADIVSCDSMLVYR
ncbi:MAG: isopentenyl transferase family protein, partial [Candidatus Omnitrophica bacterium]|nr:isopentenyl transferase family protein [Candidatus Omnitrophota bacterium]